MPILRLHIAYKQLYIKLTSLNDEKSNYNSF